jgi:hypothetical protein
MSDCFNNGCERDHATQSKEMQEDPQHTSGSMAIMDGSKEAAGGGAVRRTRGRALSAA